MSNSPVCDNSYKNGITNICNMTTKIMLAFRVKLKKRNRDAAIKPCDLKI